MKLMVLRDQSSNKSPVEDVVNGIEDWKEVGFEYILKSSSLEEFQVTLKTDVSKVSSHVLAF